MRTRWIALALAVILALAGALGLARSRAGLKRTFTSVHGTPVELIAPDAPPGATRPGVIVVHGFGGSRPLMYAISQTLARNGYAAAVIDLPGHGQNTTRLRAPGARAPQNFDATLTYVMAWLRSQPGVDGRTLALVGHSMGAGAVVRFGARDADMVATVAISGSAPGRQAARAASPRNLLTIAGRWEFEAARAGCLAAVTAAYRDGVAGRPYGTMADGTARECVLVPGADHVSVLFRGATQRALVRWLDRATGTYPADRAIDTASPVASALALHAAAFLGLVFLIPALFPAGPAPVQADTTWSSVPAFADGLSRTAMAVFIAAPLLLAAAAMRLFPTGWSPLVSADYLCGFLAAAGLVTAVGLRQLGAPLTGGHSGGVVWRAGLIGIAGATAFAVIAQAAWLNMWLTGLRPWVAGVVWPIWFGFFLAQDRLLRARPAREYLGWAVASALGLPVLLVAAVFALGAPFFLALIAPAISALLLVHAAYGAALRRATASSLPAAVLHATVFAWLTVAIFPRV